MNAAADHLAHLRALLWCEDISLRADCADELARQTQDATAAVALLLSAYLTRDPERAPCDPSLIGDAALTIRLLTDFAVVFGKVRVDLATLYTGN